MENPERGGLLREPRPQSAGHVWAWIVVAVGSVIFLAIALWVIVAGRTDVEQLSDYEEIHAISQRWSERWAQAPGPPEVYRAEALRAASSGRWDDAATLLAKAIALEPDDSALWMEAICVSVHAGSSPMALTSREQLAVFGILETHGITEPVDAIEIVAQAPVTVQPVRARCADLGLFDGSKTAPSSLDTRRVGP